MVLTLDVINQKATIQKFPMSKFRSHPIVVEFQNLYKPPARTLAARSYPSPITEELKAPQLSPPKLFLSNTPVRTPDSDSENSSSCNDSFCSEAPDNNSFSSDSTSMYEEPELNHDSDQNILPDQAQDPSISLQT